MKDLLNVITLLQIAFELNLYFNKFSFDNNNIGLLFVNTVAV